MSDLDHKFDRLDGVNTESTGLILVRGLVSTLKWERIDFLPVDLLALGSGSAAAELVYARELNIPLGAVVLVDKHFSFGVKEKLESKGVGRVVQEDMLDFMGDSTKQFSLVVGLGIEYVVEKDESKFFRAVAGVVRPGGILHLSAAPEVEESSYEESGFTRVGSRRSMILRRVE